MFAPFLWATDESVQHQADMVALGRPGIGEAFLDGIPMLVRGFAR